MENTHAEQFIVQSYPEKNPSKGGAFDYFFMFCFDVFLPRMMYFVSPKDGRVWPLRDWRWRTVRVLEAGN